jgi:peroxiredoxin
MFRKSWRRIVLATLALFAAGAWGAYVYLPYAGEMFAAAPPSSSQVNALAPAFKLPGIDGKEHALADYRGKVVVLEWTSPVCEFTELKYKSGAIQAFQKTSTAAGVVWLQISSAAPGNESHLTPETAKALIARRGLAVTDILFDDSGGVGKAYGARATPTLAIVDAGGMLRYFGAYDDAPWGDFATAGHRFAETALAAVTAGQTASPSRTSVYGCTIAYGK